MSEAKIELDVVGEGEIAFMSVLAGALAHYSGELDKEEMRRSIEWFEAYAKGQIPDYNVRKL